MILVRNIRLPLSAGEPQAFEKALHAARIPRGKVQHLGVAKLSVDARHGQPKLVYTVAVTLKEPAEEAAFAARCGDASLQQKVDFSVQNGIQPLAHRPVVCGLGPAGLFAALLSVYGFLMGISSFSEEKCTHRTSIIGSILNGIFMVGWLAFFLMGV
jgi:uncharacterized FAD-dependent dehydrogenase